MIGREGEYTWCDDVGPVWTILRDCVDIWRGRYAVVTAHDGGPPGANASEYARGWRTVPAGTITTRIAKLDELDAIVHDEMAEIWFFDTDPSDAAWQAPWHGLEANVWLRGVTLAAPEIAIANAAPTHDQTLVDEARAALRERQELLRGALAMHEPESFVRDGLIVTRDPRVVAWIVP
jgi:hypothetical protein